MGPKKKTGEDGEDMSVEMFMKNYKKNCTAIGITPSKIIKEKFDEYLEDPNNPIMKFNIWEQLGR